jgi:predicted nucleic acid-binding protein
LLEKDEHTAIAIAALMQQSKVVDVSSSIALHAAKLSYTHKLPMADSLIYATARMNEAILWTQDVDFKGLDGVKYFKKNKLH